MHSSFWSARERALWWLVFAFGVVLSIFMALRAQLGGDQRLLLQLGWSVVGNGDWLPYGMPTSAGGRSPGGLMGLLVAAPLWVWRDYRSPALFTTLLHTAAFLMLSFNLKDALSRKGQWLLLLLVWLNPWRMYFSAHLWNANLMLIAAVLHVASARRMAVDREAWNSCAQVVLIALAMQIHTSAAVLAVLSLLLLWRGMIKVHWVGFTVGVILGAAAYLPWLVAIHNDPALTPGDKGFFLRGLLYVGPFLKGVLYYLKMSSLSVASRMMDLDFGTVVNPGVNVALIWVGRIVAVLMQLTLIASIWAHWQFSKKMWPVIWKRNTELGSVGYTWLEGYLLLSMVAAFVSYAISPTTPMFWQAFVSLPAAALVLILAAQHRLASKPTSALHGVITVWSVLTVLMLLLQAVGAPQYRCGGRDAGGPDEMMLALHARMECRAVHDE